jgi:serine/threonine protein kinase
MELCKETLNEFLKERSKNYLLDEDLFKTELMVSYLQIFHSVAKSVDYIHNLNLIHRDLKPANILITKDTKIKLGDFGLATELSNKKYSNFDRKCSESSNYSNSTCLSYHTKNVGTTLYAANEQLNDNYYDQKVNFYLI